MGVHPRRRTRRFARAATIGLLVVLAGTLPGCAPEPVAPSRPTPTPDRSANSHDAPVVVDFATAAALPTDFRVLDRGRSSAPSRVTDGVWRHGDPVAPSAATYVTAPARPAPVTRIGAVADFTGPAPGSIALLVSAAPVPEDPAAAAPNAAVHFVADAQQWTYGVWAAGDRAQTVLAEGVFAGGFDPHRARFEVRLEGDRAVVYLPDATSVTLTDHRIGAFGGRYATWELFESDRHLRPAGFRELWAR